MFSPPGPRKAGSLLGLLFGVALFSSVHATNHYPAEAHATRSVVTVKVIFLQSFKQVDAFCSFLAGEPPQGNILGCFDPTSTTILVVQPSSFNDTRKLEILGHEFWHALGAKHPA